MSDLTYESMTVLDVGPFRVRIWRTEENAGPYNRDDLFNVKTKLKLDKSLPVILGPDDLIAAFVAVPRVSAVEVTNENGLGVVAYVEWPK